MSANIDIDNISNTCHPFGEICMIVDSIYYIKYREGSACFTTTCTDKDLV